MHSEQYILAVIENTELKNNILALMKDCPSVFFIDFYTKDAFLEKFETEEMLFEPALILLEVQTSDPALFDLLGKLKGCNSAACECLVFTQEKEAVLKTIPTGMNCVFFSEGYHDDVSLANFIQKALQKIVHQQSLDNKKTFSRHQSLNFLRPCLEQDFPMKPDTIMINQKKDSVLPLHKENNPSFFDQLDETIFRLNISDGKCEYISSSAQHVFGYSAENFMQIPFFIRKILHPDYRKVAWKSWNTLLENPISKHCEYKIVDMHGNERWIQQSAKAITDEAGNIVAIEGLCRNHTVEKVLEEEKRALIQQLITTQENERKKISAELHDKIGQDILVLNLALNEVSNEQEISYDLAKKISFMSGILQKSINSIRAIAYDLLPYGLDKLGLVATIDEICREFTKKKGLNIVFNSEGLKNKRLNFETEINLFRIVQEVLNKFYPSSKTEQINIRLITSFPNLVLRIKVSGAGLKIDNTQGVIYDGDRMGLQGIKERVKLLSGKIDIQTLANTGIQMIIEVPFKEKKVD